MHESPRPLTTSFVLDGLLFTCRINRPGGCARITKVHYAKDGRSVQSVDVKYVVGNGSEKEIEPSLMRPFETLERDGRKRRGRDFLMAQADEVVKKVKHAISQQQQQKKTTKRVTTNDTKNVTVTPMDKTQGQPDHSTSLSTPITPEHPSMIKDKKSSSKPVIVRTVPSFIIANSSSMEVSPLQEPMNRGIDASKKTTLVRRGLFGASSSSTTNKQQQRPQQQQQQVPKKPSIAAAKENQKENSKVEYDAEEEDLTSSSSSASSPILPKSSQEVQKAHSEALKLSLSKKQSKFILSSKKKEVPTTSADRTNTMVATAASNDKTASLRNVFDEERRKARQFLEEVFQAPHNDIKELDEEVVGDRSSTESRLDTSGSEQDDHEYGKPPV